VSDLDPSQHHWAVRKRPADLAPHLRAFLRQHRRKKQRGRGQNHDPNDHGCDRKVEARLRRLDPEVLDRLLRDEVES
jgi:hypothetical protein